jgi:alkyl sulfatase BDS1-like metallo-beta-lactamase superfamily hydrolase
VALLLGLGLGAAAVAQVPQPAEPATRSLHGAESARLPWSDRRDFDDARRGYIATLPGGQIQDAGGRVVWDLGEYGFLDTEAAPPSVHPALWRQARLNLANGLFKVVDRVYQIRGFDISNMTLVEGASGLIVIDPLTTLETARAGLELYWQHRPRRPVVAVVYTHSHADHFGGVRGVVDEAEVRAGRVRVIAPAGFLEEAVSENVLAGNAMGRRAQYQFGNTLPRGERGFVDAGLGKATFNGTITLIAPTESIAQPYETRTVDGVEIVFQTTPGTEAPAEMNLYFPQFRALDLAENATHTLHNLLPLRGAQVRDANAWAKYLNQALDQFGERSDVVLAQHHWPTWGRERVRTFLARQRDLYKFLHDQTLRLANAGYTANEIAERLQLPESLQQEWSAHGLYGSVSHDVKAVYQRYLGWYDANPAHLNPLPPVAGARKTVEYMGGAGAVLARAEADYAQGHYRWVLQVLNEVVQADPANGPARELAARAAEQLGYQAESATWRNAYLLAAAELRSGPPAPRPPLFGADVLKALSLDHIFDYLGVRLNGPKAEGKRARINWQFTDSGQNYLLNLENSALTYLAGRNDPAADVTLTLTRSTLDAVLSKQIGFREAYGSGAIALQGNPLKLAEVLGLLDEFPTNFPIVTPRSEP